MTRDPLSKSPSEISRVMRMFTADVSERRPYHIYQ